LNELNRLRELQEEVAVEKGIRADTLRRLLAKVEEYSESHRAHGLPDDLLNILKDDLENQAVGARNWRGRGRRGRNSATAALKDGSGHPLFGEALVPGPSF